MKKYNVHFMGYYSYDVIVEAENEDDAKMIAEGHAPKDDDYHYVPSGADVWEAELSEEN